MDILELIEELSKITNLNELNRYLSNKEDKIFLECNSIDDFKRLLKEIEPVEQHAVKALTGKRNQVHNLLFITLGYIRCRILNEIEKKIEAMQWDEKAVYFIKERKLLNLDMFTYEYLKEINKSEQELINKLKNMKCNANKSNWENTRKLLFEYDLLLSSAGLKAAKQK